jgi:predicted enzyme related to lactoylglutathione lyase
MIGFRVPSVDEAILAAHQTGGAVLRPIEALDWGRRVVLTDPDGRPVEVVDDIRT